MRYDRFLGAVAAADVVLTDSGGVQEEAPSLGTRVVLLRETTERPEGVAARWVRVAGTRRRDIVAATRDALTEGPRTAAGESPSGDGRAAVRIVRALREMLVDGSAVDSERRSPA